jgi:hypothetical protein
MLPDALTLPQVWILPALALCIAVAVPLYARIARGPVYGSFALLILLVSLPGAVVMHGRLVAWVAPGSGAAWMDAAFVWCMAAAGLHLVALVKPRLRSPAFRTLVSIPGMAFIAAGALAGVWLLLLLPVRLVLALAGADGALEHLRWLDVAPFAVAAASVVTSLRPKREVVRVPLARSGPDEFTRVPAARYRRRAAPPLPARPLRIVQIADPHLGPWQPVARLRRRIAELVDRDPDLVLLTGDFLTMEGMGTPGALAEALSPLRRVPGRCYATFGNHDHEAPDEVRRALAANGVRLVLDDEALVDTPVGPVQIVGADWVAKGTREHLHGLLARFPRRDGRLRLLLLHDPLAFRHVPKDDVDLTLSGHTHGGQVGLVSFGLSWTVLRRTRWPDHGLFAQGANRLYVHRGTGHYGFPLRIGVPGEHSVLELVPAAD